MVARQKKIHWGKAKSALQTTFVRRLNQVLNEKGLSDNGLAKIIFPNEPTRRQTSISRITACVQDPSLQKVQEIADALNVPPLFLLMDVQVGTVPRADNVREFPPLPPIMGAKDRTVRKKARSRH